MCRQIPTSGGLWSFNARALIVIKYSSGPHSGLRLALLINDILIALIRIGMTGSEVKLCCVPDHVEVKINEIIHSIANSHLSRET